MSNMSYCRFRNTVPDVEDCLEHLDEEPNDQEEKRARLRLIELSLEIAKNYGHLVSVLLTVFLAACDVPTMLGHHEMSGFNPSVCPRFPCEETVGPDYQGNKPVMGVYDTQGRFKGTVR